MFSEKVVARKFNLSPKGAEPGKLVVEVPASSWRSEAWTEALDVHAGAVMSMAEGECSAVLQFYKAERQVLGLILPRTSADWTAAILTEGSLSPL